MNKTKVLCNTCKHIKYCPLDPKTVIECNNYKKDNSIEENKK